MCGCQYMVVVVVVEERGRERGRLTLFLASRLAPLSRSTFATSAWPYRAERWRAVLSPYQRQTHTVRERHLAMDDTTHHSQTHMQRDMAYMDRQTCNSGLYSALLHVCMYEWIIRKYKGTKLCLFIKQKLYDKHMSTYIHIYIHTFNKVRTNLRTYTYII